MQYYWQPSATIEALKQRAKILQQTRRFFEAQNILEVETPLICRHTVTDPYLHSINLRLGKQSFFLQTSPEYCMKRLLAAGSGSIYQICKAFRQDEIGRHHNPEFTLLEWYQIGVDHFELMAQVDQYLQLILATAAADKISYQDLFKQFLAIDPLTASDEALLNCCQSIGVTLPEGLQLNKDLVLQCLMSDYIEPKIGQVKPMMIYHFPASQAALAKLHPRDSRIAERFEVYYQGIEIGNGFHELTCANEQRLRFKKNNEVREQLGLEKIDLDNEFLAALEHGLPDCSGVAMGIDRIIMLATQKAAISETLSFVGTATNPVE